MYISFKWIQCISIHFTKIFLFISFTTCAWANMDCIVRIYKFLRLLRKLIHIYCIRLLFSSHICYRSYSTSFDNCSIFTWTMQLCLLISGSLRRGLLQVCLHELTSNILSFQESLILKSSLTWYILCTLILSSKHSIKWFFRINWRFSLNYALKLRFSFVLTKFS